MHPKSILIVIHISFASQRQFFCYFFRPNSILIVIHISFSSIFNLECKTQRNTRSLNPVSSDNHLILRIIFSLYVVPVCAQTIPTKKVSLGIINLVGSLMTREQSRGGNRSDNIFCWIKISKDKYFSTTYQIVFSILNSFLPLFFLLRSYSYINPIWLSLSS